MPYRVLVLVLLLLSSVPGYSPTLAPALLFLGLDVLTLLKSGAPLLRLVLRLVLFLHLLLKCKRKRVVRVCLRPCIRAAVTIGGGLRRSDVLLGGFRLRVRRKRGKHCCEKRGGAVDRIEKLPNDLGLQSSNEKITSPPSAE
jgi:hypothetical protein